MKSGEKALKVLNIIIVFNFIIAPLLLEQLFYPR